MSFFKALRLVRSLGRSKDLKQYHAVRDRRLLDLLAVANEHVPIYCNRLPVELAGFSSIEPTNKSVLTENLLDSINLDALGQVDLSMEDLTNFLDRTDPSRLWIDEKINLAQSSGTSGKPVQIFRTRKELAMERALEIGRQNQPGDPFREYLRWGGFKLAALLHDSSTSPARQRFEGLQAKLKPFAKFLVLSIYDDQQGNIQQLNAFAPHQLVSYPVPLIALAEAKLSGACPKLNPQVITSGADVLLEADRNLLTEAFPSAKIREHYGAVECSSMAFSCSDGNLHLNEDYCILEVMNEEGNPVSDGEWGDHILVTSLVRHLQPIIRYRIEDRVKYTGTSCTCGIPLPIIEIDGRRFPDFEVLDDQGQPLKLSAYAFRRSLELPWIHRYQVVQTEVRSFKINFMPSQREAQIRTDNLVELEASLYQSIQQSAALSQLTFTFSQVESQGFLMAGHKVKQFIPFL